ncbi:MAG: SDR family NAD(P)-dependent oxidoreductase [Spongiibacter sp.]
MLAQHSSEIALITGATSALGGEFARQLAPFCKSMILVARPGAELGELAETLRAPGREVQVIAADLSQPLAVAELMEAIRQRGPVTLLVNHGDLVSTGEFARSDLDAQQAMVALHCQSTLALSRGVLPFMRAAGGGAIINVAATVALAPAPQLAVYSASMAFLAAFTRSLAQELVDDNIAVQCFCPAPELGCVEAVASSLAALSAEPPSTIVVPGDTQRQELGAALQKMIADL